MGFFQILHTTAQQQKNDLRTVMIQVTDGVLSIPNVISGLERLIPTKWSWMVENIGSNTFGTVFPKKIELQRMVECGVAHNTRNMTFYDVLLAS
jgi:hypothetical protein